METNSVRYAVVQVLSRELEEYLFEVILLCANVFISQLGLNLTVIHINWQV